MKLDKIGCEERTAKASYHMDYLNTYEQYFNKLKNKDITLVEIGIYEGASLRTWRRYFPKANIVGLDINPKVIERIKDKSITPLIGDQKDEEVLKKVPKADIIIDDGSHKIIDFVKSFNYLFRNKLKESGIYIIEDLHCIFEEDKYSNKPDTFYKFLNLLSQDVLNEKFKSIHLFSEFIIIIK